MFAFVSLGSSLLTLGYDCRVAEAVVLSFAHVGSSLSLFGLDFVGGDLAAFSKVLVCPPDFETREFESFLAVASVLSPVSRLLA